VPDHTPHLLDWLGFTVLSSCDLIVSTRPLSCSRTVKKKSVSETGFMIDRSRTLLSSCPYCKSEEQY